MTSNGKNSARNCQDGQHRFASMKLIICLERLFNRMRIANIRLTKRTEQGMRMCTLLLFFFIFIEIIKRDVVVWKIPAIQKENLEWSLR